jgi:hypothetical protein
MGLILSMGPSASQVQPTDLCEARILSCINAFSNLSVTFGLKVWVVVCCICTARLCLLHIIQCQFQQADTAPLLLLDHRDIFLNCVCPAVFDGCAASASACLLQISAGLAHTSHAAAQSSGCPPTQLCPSQTATSCASAHNAGEVSLLFLC